VLNLIQSESLPVKITHGLITEHHADCYPTTSKLPQFAAPACHKFNIVTDVLQ
jgi:hypothetical protein